MDKIIRQVALLTEIMKEIKENRAKSAVDGDNEKEESISEAKDKEQVVSEQKSEILPVGVETAKIEPDGKKIVVEEMVDCHAS